MQQVKAWLVVSLLANVALGAVLFNHYSWLNKLDNQLDQQTVDPSDIGTLQASQAVVEDDLQALTADFQKVRRKVAGTSAFDPTSLESQLGNLAQSH